MREGSRGRQGVMIMMMMRRV